ncbi:MAG: hypothetical protein JOZ72_10450 [Alphaproteobacteria bacterium]|nr:hypothetical protein [Alphaproteobacteria bacterium]
MQGGQRLWLIVGGIALLAVVLAGGGWWWYGHSHKAVVASKRPNLIGLLGDTAQALDNTKPDDAKLCSATLTRALDFGALPRGATLASDEAKAGEAEGHYSCQAQGIDGSYTLNIDTTCPGGQDKTCFALDSIKREDGSWNYRRKI